jgi:hypothetical protein
MADLTLARRERLEAILELARGAGANGITVRDVSRHLGLGGAKNKATPQVRNMLDQLVDEFHLLYRQEGVVQNERGLYNGWRYFVVQESK